MMEITFRDKKYEIKSGMTAREALRKIGIDPESVLIVLNGTLATDDTLLKEGDKVKLVAVVSGGRSDTSMPDVPRSVKLDLEGFF